MCKCAIIHKKYQISYGVKMANKQITTVYLERQPHWDAYRRLQLAYAYLIEDNQIKIEENETQNPPTHQEVES
jgi:hypothetical protein